MVHRYIIIYVCCTDVCNRKIAIYIVYIYICTYYAFLRVRTRADDERLERRVRTRHGVAAGAVVAVKEYFRCTRIRPRLVSGVVLTTTATAVGITIRIL